MAKIKREKSHKTTKKRIISPAFSKISKKVVRKHKAIKETVIPKKKKTISEDNTKINYAQVKHGIDALLNYDEKIAKISKKVVGKQKAIKETVIPKKKKTISEDNTKINYAQVKHGIDALLNYDEKIAKNDLFDEERTIFLQFRCIKIPQGPSLRLRFPVKHPLVTDKCEICLIVRDLKKGRKLDHEPTVEHYEELLKSQNITCVKRILPFRQLKVEYDGFELIRRLYGFFDYFLVDGRIGGHVSHVLGRTFYNSTKMPIPIHLDSKNLKETINHALSKVQLNLRCTGDSYLVPVGHNKMTSKMILDNVKCIVNCLCKFFPGGWDNIRGLYVKTTNSIAIPVYITLKSANDVPVPIIKEKRPLLYKSLAGELSTSMKYDVIVEPTGDIELVRKGRKESINKTENKISDEDGKVKMVDFPIVFKKGTSSKSVLKKKKTNTK